MAGERIYGRYWDYTKELRKEHKDMNLYIYRDYDEKLEVANLIYNFLKKHYKMNIKIIKLNGKFINIAGRCSWIGRNKNGESIYKIELKKNIIYLVDLIDTVCHELAHVFDFNHDNNHFNLTKEFISLVMKNLKDDIFNIFNQKRTAAKVIPTKTSKISIIKKFITRGKNGNGMMIDFTVFAEDDSKSKIIGDKLFRFFRDNNLDVWYTWEGNKISIVFEITKIIVSFLFIAAN